MSETTIETGPTSGGKSATRILAVIARVLMGLIFFVFGLNGFLNFIQPPKEGIPPGAMAFGMAMMKTGYLSHLVSGTEVLVGALLLANRFVPLALALIAPVIVNIFLFHVFLAPDAFGMGMATVISVCEVFLAWTYRENFRPMLGAVAHPK